MVREFTPEEKTKIVELRSNLANISSQHKDIEDDYYLVRWLRARNHDVVKAEEMLRTSLAWRKENNIDGILDRPEDDVPLKYKRLFPTGYFGHDKEGNPIVCLPLGRYNNRTIIAEIGMEQFLRYNMYWMESMLRIVKNKEAELGIKGLQLIEVVDMEQYSFREIAYKPSREFIVESQRVFEANYPEILKTMLIINAPKIFAIAFKLVKPLMPKETLAKMDIYGQHEDEWKNVIAEKFPLTNIPSRWGGTLKSTDPFATQDLSVWVDVAPLELSYFTQEGGIDENGFTKVKVGARDKFKMDVPVTSTGSELRWRFSTEGHDIGFQVNCPSGKNPVPWSRLDSHNYTQEGYISCERVGKYQLVFDNSFSFTKSKVVKYYVEVIEGEDLEDVAIDAVEEGTVIGVL